MFVLRLTSNVFHISKFLYIKHRFSNYYTCLLGLVSCSHTTYSLNVRTYYFTNIVPNLIFKQNKFAIFQTFSALFGVITTPFSAPFRGSC